MNTYRVGEEVVGESYNEAMKTWSKRNFSLWVGVTDAGEEYVFFSGDTELGEAYVSMPYIKEEVGAIERLLITAQEWVNVAKKNHADTDRVLGCFPDAQYLTCEKDGTPHAENQMGLRFNSSNDGQQSRLIIDLVDQSNRFKRATIYFGPLEIGAIAKNVRQLGPALSKAKETARKQQHLFKRTPKDASTVP